MNRTLFAVIAVLATAALTVPLAVADHRPGHKTPPAPPAPNPDLSIAADPDIVPFGKTTTISGRLRVQDNAAKTIELGENPYPFTGNQQFKPVSTTTTDANGDYSFQVAPELHTNYRVRTRDVDPAEVSAPALVRVKMRITRRVSDRTPSRGEEVTFSGKVRPAHDGLSVLIQRRRPSGSWRTLQTAVLAPGPATEDSSVYSTQVTINRDGVWRARIKADEHHLGNRSRRIRLNVP